MIVNIEQKSGSLIISYINKEGNISYKKINIPANQQYSYVEAYNRSQSTPGIQSWDGKPVKKIPAQFLSKYRLQEFFMDAGEEITGPLFENNMPNLHSLDIEVDVTDDGFPEAEFANNRINTFAWSHYPNVTVFGLKELSGSQIQSIQKEINDHLKPIGREYNFLYKKYDNEAEMIMDFMKNYMRHAPLVTGWNFWRYDWQYMYNRCRRLGIDISWMSPTNQWYKHRVMNRNKRVELMLPQHMLLVDYMDIYQKWDRSVDVKENYSLDWTAQKVLGVNKVKYPGSFQDLYRKDFDQYVFYNAIDTILVEEIHYKLKTMGTFLGLGNITRVEAMNAFSPISMLESTLARYAYKRGWVFPKINKKFERESYEGAFVFDPTSDLYEWVTSLDFASLYPSIMRQWLISIENFVTKDLNYQPNEHQIKCSSGAVFDSSREPLLPEILTDYYDKRKESKKISQQAEREASEIENILKQRQKKITQTLG